MFGTLARIMYRRRWYVIAAWIVVLAIAMSQAAQVGSILGPGSFVQKGSDSDKAATLLDRKFHQNDLKVTLIVLHSPGLTVHDSQLHQLVTATAARVWADRGLRVAYLDNPLVTGNQQLISRDGHSVALLVSSKLAEPKIEDQIDHLRSIVRSSGLQTYVTGTAAENHDNAVQSKSDLSRGDGITIPIMIVILLLVFGTLVASSLPVILAGCSIVLSMAAVFVFGHFVDTSIYVTNVITGLGLGVGIDYSLFIVFRFREELERFGGDVEAAVVRTMETTGRAIFFSGLTVAIGLSSLILTGLSFMVSMGLGGVLVPVSALLVAMTLLPALLSVLGPRVNRLRLLPRRFLGTARGEFWRRLATTIMNRPLLTGGAVLVIMLALAFPVTQLNLAFGSLKNAPQSMESVQGILYMRAHFPSQPDPTQVVITAPGGVTRPQQLAGIQELEQEIRHDPEAAAVVGPADFVDSTDTVSGARLARLTGRYISPDGQTAIVSVTGKDDVGTLKLERMVRRLRTLSGSFERGALRGDAINIGGAQASYTDFNDALYAHFPLIIAIVLLLTYAFLFYAFRSLFLPLKAVLLNLLSVGAAYGTLQLVFQRGVASSVLGFTPESGVAGWVPIFLFAFLFGLSMDYEVFLLSRVREFWLATGDNARSVTLGLERTGRLISSAAAVMVIAFSGFILGHELMLKEFGVGLVVSIALDATLIRLVLVPSIMELAGPLNWWLPSFLRGLASRGPGLEGGEELVLEDALSA